MPRVQKARCFCASCSGLKLITLVPVLLFKITYNDMDIKHYPQIYLLSKFVKKITRNSKIWRYSQSVWQTVYAKPTSLSKKFDFVRNDQVLVLDFVNTSLIQFWYNTEVNTVRKKGRKTNGINTVMKKVFPFHHHDLQKRMERWLKYIVWHTLI